ncbi:hypothetical protein GCM10022222_31520 [Amycolatopsis ultiminotia]|uniref:Uncharacterized protein n=1 Tax=Amycolatopsis ultiminotia TaxID=543629 RepID=A0ABP6W7K8_9PSEU
MSTKDTFRWSSLSRLSNARGPGVSAPCSRSRGSRGAKRAAGEVPAVPGNLGEQHVPNVVTRTARPSAGARTVTVSTPPGREVPRTADNTAAHEAPARSLRPAS